MVFRFFPEYFSIFVVYLLLIWYSSNFFLFSFTLICFSIHEATPSIPKRLQFANRKLITTNPNTTNWYTFQCNSQRDQRNTTSIIQSPPKKIRSTFDRPFPNHNLTSRNFNTSYFTRPPRYSIPRLEHGTFSLSLQSPCKLLSHRNGYRSPPLDIEILWTDHSCPEGHTECKHGVTIRNRVQPASFLEELLDFLASAGTPRPCVFIPHGTHGKRSYCIR